MIPDPSNLAAIVVGALLLNFARVAWRRAGFGPRRYVIELGHHEPAAITRDAELPGLPAHLALALADYAREHPELETARVTVEVPR